MFEGEGAADSTVYVSAETLRHHQEVHSMSEQPSSLGLSLKKTQSLVNLIECELNQTNKKKNVDDSTSPMLLSEKLKASNFRACSLKIGDWEVISQHDGNIVAKSYYAKRKLVWEILEGPLKSKIELQWSNIVGIRATILDNKQSILEIELNEPPLFYRETAPQPKKHTLWEQSHDFTGGRASQYRLHEVRFPAGALEKTYENILLCDPRLYTLSRSSFPTQQSPFFESYVHVPSHFFGEEYRVTHHPQGLLQSQYQNCPPTFVPPHLQTFKIETQHCGLDFDSPMSGWCYLGPFSVMNFNRNNKQGNNYTFARHGDNLWNQEYFEENNDLQQVLLNQEFNNMLKYDERRREKEILKGIEEHFLGEEELFETTSSPIDQHILSSLDPLEGLNINSNACMENTQENVMLPEASSWEQQRSPIHWWSPDDDDGSSSTWGGSMAELPQQNQPLQPALCHLPASQDHL